MAEKQGYIDHAEHFEHDKQAVKLEQELGRTHIADDVPIQEALDQHLDEDPKRLARIKRKLDLRLTFMLACLYTCAFIDRANLGNVNHPHEIKSAQLLKAATTTGKRCGHGR